MRWHLYCRVVDNFGDIGVAWRLAADLAGRGESVRLAVDDTSALAWLAPSGTTGVEVVAWHDDAASAQDVVVELFGAGLPDRASEKWGDGREPPPVFINLEHLSAEAYVERSHGLPSPRRPRRGPPFTTWFFYPGFTARTGGLLREPGLLDRRRAVTGAEWLAAQGIAVRPDERRVSLFCYRNDAIASLLDALAATPTLLLLTPGPASDQVAAVLGPSLSTGALRAVRLPRLTQAEFDRLLWSCELNFVRGEDSLARALWAGAPFVWQLYPQDDGAHRAKLAAFVDRFLAGASPALAAPLRSLFARWNGIEAGALELPPAGTAPDALWADHCLRWRDALAAQTDLVSQLIRFVESKR